MQSTDEADPSATIATAGISGTFAPGGFADQLAALHAMGASCRVEIGMPDDTSGSVRLCGGSVHQAIWGEYVGIDALTAMAVHGGGDIRLCPANAEAADELHVMTPALLDLLRQAEARHRTGPVGTGELPQPDAVGGQDGMLQHAHVRRRAHPDLPVRNTDSGSFPEDWLGDLVPQDLRTAASSSGGDGTTTADQPAIKWDPPAVGGMLGRCYLGAEIGRGATAVVYRALHITLKIDVAVKVFVPGPDGLPALPLDEARLLARLSHPNVLRVLDCSDERPWPHLICEYVDGFTMAELIERSGSLEPIQALRMVMQAADGLAYAAGQGVVHCDVKPANLLVSRQDGTVRIADLGLARVMGGHSGASDICGTPAYISPEQVEQGPVTPATDVYSLGCTLWHALVGEPPFVDPDPVRTMVMHVSHRLPALSSRLEGCDSRLERLVGRMLSKYPSARPDYAELVAELRQVLNRLERSGKNPFDQLGTRVFRTLRLAVDSVRRALGAA